MKNIFVATFLAISGFAISSLAIASPVNAQTAIIAALYQNPTAASEVRYENATTRRDQIILAVNTTPEMIAITENLSFNSFNNGYDRIVTMHKADNLVCMVNGSGSVDGAVMCGFIDHE
jgi:hypothetical protein